MEENGVARTLRYDTTGIFLTDEILTTEIHEFVEAEDLEDE